MKRAREGAQWGQAGSPVRSVRSMRPRVDTCGSRAGKEIQKLRRELKGLRPRRGIKKKPGRDGRKDF